MSVRRFSPLLTSVLLLLLATLPPSASAGEGDDRKGVRDAPAYPHRKVRRVEMGTGVRSYWLFEPADPTPERAPVIVFQHGWLAMNPGVYGAWIEHLARRGSIVIYPRYQEGWIDSSDHFLKNSIDATRDALDVLQTSAAHVKPDLKRFALIGHSTGGVLSVQMAAVARRRGLPTPRAIIAVTPGEVRRTKGPSPADIPAESTLVIIAAEHDLAVGDAQARLLFAEARTIPADRKLFVLYRTDLRGRPGLFADHLAATASLAAFDTGDGPLHDFQMSQGAVNALDRSGIWRIADLTLDAAFAGKTLAEATDQGNAFRRLGYWNDGRAVLAPIVAKDLSEIPRVLPAHGIRLIPWAAP